MQAVDAIINVYKSFNLGIATLLHSIQLLNRCLDDILKNQNNIFKYLENSQTFIIIGLICLNLASKYQERVAFKITDLLRLNEYSSLCDSSPEIWRQNEFQVLKCLNFKIGGEVNPIEFIENSLNRIQGLNNLPLIVK